MRGLIILLFSSIVLSVSAQNELIIQSDRPGIGYNANTVGKGVVLHQFGIQWSRTLYNSVYHENHDLTSNLRIGLLDDLEVHWNLNFNGTYSKSRLDPSDPNYIHIDRTYNRGFSMNSIGVRYTFLRGNQWKPTMAIMGDLETPLVNEDYRFGKPTGSILLITNWNFDNGIFWGITTGITDIGYTFSFPYAINFGGYIGEKISLFIEYYGSTSIIPSIFPNNPNEIIFRNAIDGGITFQPHKNIVLDLFGGWGLIDYNYTSISGNNFFASLGITWAIQAWNKQ